MSDKRRIKMSVERQKEVDRLFNCLVEVYINLTENWRAIEEKYYKQYVRALVTLVCRKPICTPYKNPICIEEVKWLPYERRCSEKDCRHKYMVYKNYEIKFAVDKIGKTSDTLLDMRRFSFHFLCLLSRFRGLTASCFENPHLIYLKNRLNVEYGCISARSLYTKYTEELDSIQISLKGLFEEIESFREEPLFRHSFDEPWLWRVLNYFLLEKLYPEKVDPPKTVLQNCEIYNSAEKENVYYGKADKPKKVVYKQDVLNTAFNAKLIDNRK